MVTIIYISHRGNIFGPNLLQENHPDYLKEAIKLGYHVETDLWYIHDQFVLGHDNPQYEIDKHFLYNDKIWVHTKNIEALHVLASLDDLTHYFFHNIDDATITSRGWLWTYPGKLVGHAKSVCVMPEILEIIPTNLYYSGGICTDYPEKYKLNSVNFSS